MAYAVDMVYNVALFYTIDMVYAVDMIFTVHMVYVVDIVYTADMCTGVVGLPVTRVSNRYAEVQV